MPEYTGWDDYLNEKEQERHKAENPLLEARLSVIENRLDNIDRHLYPVLDRIRDIIEILEYNQIGLPLAHGKRFVPANVQDRWKAGF